MIAKVVTYVACAVVLVLCWAPRVQAQADEPGLGGPAEDGAKPPPSTPAPPLAPDPVKPPPAGDPETALPPPEPPAGVASTDDPVRILARAQQRCQAGKPCPLVAQLIRLLTSTQGGVGAAGILGRSGDKRAVIPLAQAAVYGRTEDLRRAAKAGLSQLVLTAGVRGRLRRIAQVDPDPRTRAVLLAAAGGKLESTTDLKLLGGLVGREESKTRAARPGQRTKYRFADPESTRMIYSQTAFTRKKGTWDWTLFELGLWNFDYGVTDWLEVGLEAAPPVVFLTMFPHIKIGTNLSDNVSVGVRVMGGFIYSYLEDVDASVGLIGGGPILTIGDADMAFNVSWPVYGIFIGEEQKDYGPGFNYNDPVITTEYHSLWVTTPNIAFGWRVHKRIKLNFELYTILAQDFELNGEFWLFTYGIRVMGQRIFGDICFVVPLFENSDEVLQYTPMGFPLLVFGFQW